ncbi:hypothetical protein [Mesorhizobium sp. CO1-1-9]|uniref:hypothetical protein n=1 Tax=Mesorhizobium sp. CO1-1-9 TaxID=2876630 RepID=UPI001CCB968E|nr:hypothetical protein [Mesorhizobium sp. CO1-1-9]MBZ9696474.1 hypothetical protein [Mesorhizobium sp. CO1-1-9]
MSGSTVKPLFRVVANGVKDAKTLRLTVIATPQQSAEAGAFELADWPKAMAQGLRDGVSPFPHGGLVLWVREIGGKIPKIAEHDWTKVTMRPSRAAAYSKPSDWLKINELWNKALVDPGATWEELAADIARSLEGSKHAADLKDSYSGKEGTDRQIEEADEAAARATLADDGSIAVHRPKSEDALTVGAVLPIRQSDIAVEEETVRAARILAKQYAGPFSVLDERKVDLGAVGSAKDRFAAAIKATRDERIYSKNTYDKIKEALSSETATGVADGAPVRPSLIPEVADVVAPEAEEEDDGKSPRKKRRATQEYGGWLQRRYGLTGKKDENRKEGGAIIPPVIDDQALKDDDKTAALMAIRGTYFAMQGDPMLSRLFGLAFDFEAPLDKFPSSASLSKPGFELRLHLAVSADAGALSDTCQVATAAKLHLHGFWPVSVFDIKAPGQENKQAHLVEQSDGVWKLGATTVDGPRYELASLDIRRSVDSKSQGRDRGEAHRTGGFTILDRGRSEQIVRDIALADINRDKLGRYEPIVVLHAEELTIGRRIDVAVASANKPLDRLVWRSLMQRFVDLDFGKNDKLVESVLYALMGTKTNSKGLLEETSFQTAARFLPKTSDDGKISGFEAVADEAIFLWDGTPASVLTDGRPGNESIPSGLPFGRTLDLPGSGAGEAGLRPPPLRFGVPYLFRFRSMLLGGGSPSPSTPTEHGTFVPAERHVMKDGHYVKAVTPRRYLRHESIGAPILLLPRHLADYWLKQMGYELVDQAIVRSWNDENSKLTDILLPDDIKGEYVGKDIRTNPTETIRVFIAPEAPHDLVSAHGRLDNPDAVEVRKGGLRDVSYTPRKNHGGAVTPQDESERPSGFPVAVSTRRDSLDDEGVIYPRTVFPVKDGTPRGIPVFEPGGHNTAQTGEVGYLPDPAIVEYSLRAKITGSDKYLKGAQAVPLYQGNSYPHALPLAVKVVRVAAVRISPPGSISDIAKAPQLTSMDLAGMIPAKDARRARVQFVEITLYQGEDFELEVSCLPDVATLADRFSVPETMAMQLSRAASDEEARGRLREICGDSVLAACTPGGADSLTGLGGQQVPVPSYRRKVAEALLDAMKSKWPVEEIAAVKSLRVHHALNKPLAKAIRWLSDDPKLRSIRTQNASVCVNISNKNSDEPDATDLIIDGTVELDLDLVESFHVIATTVATSGFQIDAPERGRSLTSRRSGRWPVVTNPDGADAYAMPTDVVGFAVAEDGRVTLPREPVTLLSLGNLPSTKAIGPLSPVNGDTCAANVFTLPKDGARLAGVSLLPLFAAAISGTSIEQSVAMLPEGRDQTKRKKALQIKRPHVFKDTLARRLTLDLVAVSRGAAAFETAPTYIQGKEQTLFRRQPLRRIDQATRSATPVELWMKSTKAPASPEARRPEPSFIFRRSATAVTGKTTIEHVVQRHALARIYLGRGWFSSGEGERLGIVLWPPRYDELNWQELDNNLVLNGGRTMELKDFQDRDLGAAGAYVTRWGGDPIRLDKSVQEGNFIPPNAFADMPLVDKSAGSKHGDDVSSLSEVTSNPHRPKFVSEARMPVPKAAPPKKDDEKQKSAPQGGEREFLAVSLLTYEPCFDLDREEWYVDVDLRANRASEPFVRFGLVRYQENAISPDLMTSEPVALQLQLLPKRKVSVNVELLNDPATAGRKVTVEVSGRGSRGIKELKFDDLPAETAKKQPEWKNSFDRLKLPKIRAVVFHESGDAGNRIRKPIKPEGWPIAFPEGDLPLEMPEANVDGDPDLVWKQCFDLSGSALGELGKGQLVIYLEEIDLRMPAAYREEPVTLDKMFDKTTFVTSGPRFSARVPFLELS